MLRPPPSAPALAQGLAAALMLAAPSLVGAAPPLPAALAALDFRVEAEWNGEVPGNLTIGPDGAVYLSMHQFGKPRFPVVRLEADGSLRPYPSASLHLSDRHGLGLDAVLGLQCDDEGVLWMLDNGLASKKPPKLVAWDTRSHTLHKTLEVPEYVLRRGSFLNDLAIDRDRRRVYIADTAPDEYASLIVMDLESGLARRVLQGHWSVVADAGEDLVIDGRPVEVKGPGGKPVRPHLGINPIGLDPAGEWLYYGPMHGGSISRIPAEILARSVEPDAPSIVRHVELVGDKPTCDGATVAADGTVYLGELAANALGAVGPDGTYRRLASHPRWLSWVDAFSYGTDGRVYGVANRLHETAYLSAGARATRGPFYVFSFQPESPGAPGR